MSVSNPEFETDNDRNSAFIVHSSIFSNNNKPIVMTIIVDLNSILVAHKSELNPISMMMLFEKTE